MSARVLLISYYFPPLGLAGVGRALNLFQYLPAHGWECDILTVKPVTYRAYEPELLENLDMRKIHRAGSYDPQRLMYLLGMRTVTQKTIARGKPISQKMFPDGKKGWIGPAVRKGKQLLKRHRYKAIISTSPPISSHVIARQLAGYSGLPWLADFRDFWSMYKVEETFMDPSLIKQGKELLQAIRTEAAAVTGVNQSIIDYLENGQVIRNGYDPKRADRWCAPDNREEFVIGIPGNLGEERVIEPLLDLLDQVKERHPEQHQRVRLVQLGQVEPEWITNILDRRGYADRYTIHGLRKRDETIDILSDCTAFFIGLTAEREQGILPQRMFDLAASGRPILAYCDPMSEITNMIGETGNGLSYSDVTMANAVDYLSDQIKSWTSGKLVITPRPSYALTYSATEMARTFAAALDSLR